MSWPPSLLRLRVVNGNRRFRLWLPLFIIWPPLLALAVLLWPLVVIISAALRPRGWGLPALLAGPLLFRLFCALRGLEVNVEGASEQVHITFS